MKLLLLVPTSNLFILYFYFVIKYKILNILFFIKIFFSYFPYFFCHMKEFDFSAKIRNMFESVLTSRIWSTLLILGANKLLLTPVSCMKCCPLGSMVSSIYPCLGQIVVDPYILSYLVISYTVVSYDVIYVGMQIFNEI